MNKNSKTYNSIFKTTGLFGGVEGLKIIFGALQSKILAILLGPTGVGIEGLLNTAINTISSISGLGLRTSAVREIAEANSTNDYTVISNTIITLRRFILFTGIIGALITIIISPFLSQWTFGNKDYTWTFVFLSVIILLNSLISGHLALIQGMRYINNYAKANLFSVILGVVLSVSLYYLLGLKGIVPALIVSAFSRLVFSFYYSKKINIVKTDISYRRSLFLGSRMVKLGFFLMLSSSLSLFFSYVTNAYILRISSIEYVGLYRAGFLITTYYVSLVFSAMGADYLPRLSEFNNDNIKSNEIVNQQAEIAILIISPLVVSLITFAPIFISLLYSNDFIQITDFIVWAILAMLFRASSWCMSFLLLAKGKGFLFFITEISIGLFNLILNILGFKYYGLTGLGIAYILCYIVYFIMHYIIDRKLFHFSFNKDFVKLFVVLNLMCFASLILYKFVGHPWMYLYGSLMTLFVFLYSYKELSKRIDFKEIIGSLKNKLKKNDRK
ncbi:MAG: oligosaccharide flippase family protein [Bacteroidales bacterium]|nr:oligosaccharide flippase family protein [Bacteroidales bacterium]